MSQIKFSPFSSPLDTQHTKDSQREQSNNPNLSLKPSIFITPTQDPCQSIDNNSSYFQLSTQQSLCTKKSFSIASPKPSNYVFHHFASRKLKICKEKSLTECLNEDLKIIQNESQAKSINNKEIERIYDFEAEKNIQNACVLENEFGFEISQLKWCAFCVGEVVTEVEYVNSSATFWASLGIFFTGGIFGCFLLPYVTNCCKAVKLVCHKCKRPIG